MDAVLDAAGVRDGSRVLEIGTGWGSLAIRAAERGATVTTLTISAQQAELARERIAAAGDDRPRRGGAPRLPRRGRARTTRW